MRKLNPDVERIVAAIHSKVPWGFSREEVYQSALAANGFDEDGTELFLYQIDSDPRAKAVFVSTFFVDRRRDRTALICMVCCFFLGLVVGLAL